MSSNQGTGNINYSFDISNIYKTINGNKTFLFNYYLSIFISLIFRSYFKSVTILMIETIA